MELFKWGKVISQGKNYIIFESNSRGWIIYVSNPKLFEINKRIKLFTYKYTNEYVKNIYGFNSFKERILFEDLISVNGIGPKTAMGIINQGFDNVSTAISEGKANVLLESPMVGQRTANQIIFELSEKYQKMKITSSNKILPSEISKSLKVLGFSQQQVDMAIKKIEPKDSIEEMVEDAIRIIGNGKFI